MRIVVVDAANCLYRAFFAIPPLRAADGFPTNAIYGFVNMLRKVMREEQPDVLVVVFDPPGGSFRQEIYAEYKAGRDAQPEDLSAQLPVVHEVVEAYGIPTLTVPGFEADDVIATLVDRAPADAELRIVSTDKDLMQLVSDRVLLLDTMKDRRIGPAEVRARFGVGPEQLLDLRSLVGDPSDNIPGVKGIGEKGAAKLVEEWGDLESILAHADEVKAKRAREALQGQAEEARLSKRLATLRRDVPLERGPEALPAVQPDLEALRELFERLSFGRLVEELAGDAAAGGGGAAAAAVGAVETEAIESAAALEKLVDHLHSLDRLAILLLGCEATSGLPPPPVALAFALEDERAAYLPVEAGLGAEAVFEALRPLFEGPAPRSWLAVDGKRVQSVLAEQGVAAATPGFDLGLAAFLLDASAQHSVASLAGPRLGRRLRSWEELAGRGAKAKAAAALPPSELMAWAGEEVCALAALAAPLAAELERDGLAPLFEEVELPLTAVLSRMERAGVRVDEEALGALSREFAAELQRLEERIHELAGEPFAVGSPKQLQHVLFEVLGLQPLKKTKTGYSTDESVLEQLAEEHELPARVLAYRRLAKLKSTYVDALPPLVHPKTGRIHPTFHQTGAATGRLSCSNPNVQNIPIRTENGSRIREAFVPAEGRVLLSADYSQVELRILAHYSGDASLIEAFQAGEDIHRRTAAEVAGIPSEAVDEEQRARAKAVNFGIIYGLSAFGLANQLRIPTAEAQKTIDAYFERYRGVRAFLDGVVEEARERGFVTTLLGRRRRLPDLASRNRVLRTAAERMAVNTVIQGTAADLMKKAMVEVAVGLEEEGLAASMILQVHDELVFEVAPGDREALGELARERMQGVYALDVPLVVELGTGASWREAH